MKKTIHLLLLLVTVATSHLHAQKIIGGTASPDNKPFYCRIVWPAYDNRTVFGNGLLIAPDWILTSGVCVSNMNIGGVLMDTVDAIMGSGPITATPATARIRGNYIARHPNFTISGNFLENDIALVHLSQPVTGVTPVKLPAYGDTSWYNAGQIGQVLGHGIVDTSQIYVSDTLRMASLTVIHNDTSNVPNRYNGGITGDMFCAGNLAGPAASLAGGDHGSPFYVEQNGAYIYTGVGSIWLGYSTPRYYATARHPAIFMRVANYRSWIDDVINNYNQTVAVKSPAAAEPGIRTYTSQGAIQVQLSHPLQEEATYALYDLSGRIIANGTLAAGTQKASLPTGAYAKGVYVLRLSSHKGLRLASKCIVE